MKLLAIELSSNQGGVALFEDGHLLVERSWQDRPRLGQQIFMVTPRLLNEHGWSVDQLEAIAVGRGPGSYAGLRIAISYAHGLALPGATKLYTVKSSEALAAGLAESYQDRRILVVGDARRSMLWVHEFERDQTSVALRFVREEAIPVSQAADKLSGGALVASPDWSRLETLARGLSDRVRWLEGNHYPQARDVARLVFARLRAGVPSEPLLPIYTHPPIEAAASNQPN